MSKKYLEIKGLNMPTIEKETLNRWQNESFFEQSITNRNGQPPFVFYEGPPSANGMPGIHHVISRTLKDLVCRYKTMRGYQVKRKAGWDTHGLPVELGVEKELGITKEDIGSKISIEEYNRKCREVVMRYKDRWDSLTQKMGYWVDLESPYITFDNEYIESLWWALKSLYQKGLLYKSVSIQPYSPAAGTGLSSHELNQPGTYKEVKDTTVTAMFKADSTDDRLQFLFEKSGGRQVYFMAWTTTPWTLPSNLGLTVGAGIEYCLIHTINPYTNHEIYVVIAKKLIVKYLKAEGESADFETYNDNNKIIPWRIIDTFKGAVLENARYEQLLPFDSNKASLSGGDPFRIILGDFVTTEDGTGIVHTAPAFGADDFKVGKANNLGILTLVDREGKFVEGTGTYAGRFVKNYKNEEGYTDVNVDIAVDLKQKGLAFRVEKYEHSYPHCWRTDKPIIYYPLDAWFIKTTALKDRMINLNQTINWKPKATGEGRFGNWLENMVDWNLSRSRFWGTPLPIWINEDGTEIKCIGSIAELQEEIKQSIAAKCMSEENDITSFTKDLHKPFVDNIVLSDSKGRKMYREADLIDVWFDSGAMPFAQWHFPFENKEIFAQNYPADFIAEGVDQTRGWFYTLHALASLLKEAVEEELLKSGIEIGENKYSGIAYKAVVSNGLVLDKNGNKMSKRLGNVVDPFDTIEKYSADATRWYLITNSSPWDSLRFDSKGIEEVQRKFFGTLFNTYQFFALYANVDQFCFQEKYIPLAERPEMDRWIMSVLNSLIGDVERWMDDYEPTQAGRAIEIFVDEQLSNWYVRLCRRRFWKGEYEYDKICAYQTLYECLEKLSLLIAPISPFFADWLYTNLNKVSGLALPSSVHLADYPTVQQTVIDKDLEERMQIAQDVSSLVLSLRKKVNIKVRQPLQKILIPILYPQTKDQVERVKDIILAEVNVKEIEYINGQEDFIKKKIKPNFKILGKKVGAKMKAVAAMIATLENEQIKELEKQKQLILKLEETECIISMEDVEIVAEDIPGWSVANKGDLTVALDIQLTNDLINEGNARELVNRIQKLRKETGLELTDRIILTIEENAFIHEVINKYGNYVRSEILADTIEIMPFADANSVEIDLNDTILKVLISKKS